MVTKYDLFGIVYKNGQMRPIEINKNLGKSKKEYKNVYRLLKELEKERLLNKVNGSFEANKDWKSKLLYELIYQCLRNDINYNLLIDKNLVNFIARGLKKGKLNPRTFTRYINILNKCGLILLVSKKPLKAKIFYNSFINNLLAYFGFKSLSTKEREIDLIKIIRRELALFKKLKRKNEIGFRKIIDEFEVSFIHHSLALEGNPITLQDTIKILQDKVIPSNLRSEDVDEIKNYQMAILKMIKDSESRKLLTINEILNYHRLAMFHRQDMAGKIRKIEVYIKGNPNFKVSKVKDIKEDLEKLIYKYNKFIKERNIDIKNIIYFASYFHNEFQHIHPFIDGNSRITRLITFHLLNSMGIPVLDLPLGLLDEYQKDTKGSKARNDKKLFKGLQKIILFNLKKINERLII